MKQIRWEKEYSDDVDKKRKALVEQSYYKYGSVAVNFGRGLVDPIATMNRCIEKYEETHNKEYLLDAMNYLMFEYMYPTYNDAFYKNTDSNESAGIVGMSINEIEGVKENDV